MHLSIYGSQDGHVVSSQNSILATQVWLPPEETAEKKIQPKKWALNELDSQCVQ